MKRTILLMFLTTVSMNAQKVMMEHANFKLDDQLNAIWQKVYEKDSEDLLKDLEDTFSRKTFTKEVIFTNGNISGPSNVLAVTKMPASIHSNEFTAFIKIDIKENRYRVTVSDLKFEPFDVNTGNNAFSVSQSIQYTFEEITMRDRRAQGFKMSKRNKRMLESFDYELNNVFKPKEESKDEEW